MTIKVNWNLRSLETDYDRMSASVWIRCHQLLPYLEELGVQSTLNRPEAGAGIEVFLRNQGKEAYKLARKLKKQGRRIIFDLVVNYFDETEIFEGDYGSPKERVEECLCMVEVADSVICCSDYIRKRASQFHPSAVYLTDSIDLFHFRFRKPLTDFHKPVLSAVWSGIHTKSSELASLYPLLRSRGIPLIVISDKRVSLPGPSTFIPWSYHTFPRSMLEGDICLSPRRTDNTYDRGHSHFKIGSFMAMGIPALASPLESYTEVVSKTGGGRICDSPVEWEHALDEILRDRCIVEGWSEAAVRGMQSYSTEVVVRQYLDLFKALS